MGYSRRLAGGDERQGDQEEGRAERFYLTSQSVVSNIDLGVQFPTGGTSVFPAAPRLLSTDLAQVRSIHASLVPQQICCSGPGGGSLRGQQG